MINVNEVSSVLLADGWHDVEPRTFRVITYDFTNRDAVTYYAQPEAAFSFHCAHSAANLEGPLSSVLAVKTEG